MKFAIILLALVGSTMAGCDSRRRRDEFESFRRQYRKEYASEAEADYRCGVYSDNADKIEAHNLRAARGLESWTLAVNKYTDYTHEEFMKSFTGLRPELEEQSDSDPKRQVYTYNPNLRAVEDINWVTQGYVSPIKNQGRCGSCWSFTTIAVIESQYALAYNKPYAFLDLSEQHLVECSSAYGNAKCNGGLMTNTYKYLINENHGTQYEMHYPYTSADGKNGTDCRYDHLNVPARITGYVEIAKDDASLAQAVATKGPIAIAMNAGNEDFQFYSGGSYCPTTTLGLLSGCSWLTLNHAVLLVGYTAADWIIKNSWGEGWGEAGYFRICRRIANMCGVNRMSSYPIVA